MVGTAAAPAPAAAQPQNPLASFFWGDNNGLKLTPQQVAAQRAIAQSIIAQQGAPKNVGEGLSAIGKALIARDMMNQANTSQTAGVQSSDAAMAAAEGDPSKLLSAVENPWLNPGQQAVATAMMTNRFQLMNPMFQAQLQNTGADTALKMATAGMYTGGGAAVGAPIFDAAGNPMIPTQYGGLRPLSVQGQGGGTSATSQPTDTSAPPPSTPPAAIISPPVAPAPLPPVGGVSSAAPTGQPGKFLTPSQQKEADAAATARGTYAGDLPKLRNTMMSENRDVNQGYAVNTNLINKAINLINSTNPNDLFDQNTGMGSYLTAVKGSKAYDLQQILSSIGGAEMLNKIAQMKDDSANGASGISRVTQMEAQMMQGLNGSLSQAQSRDQLLASLQGAKSQMASAASLRAHAFQDTFGQPLVASKDDPFAAPGASIAAMPGGVPTVTSLTEAKSLPQGTHFYDPQGVLRVVP